MGMCKVNKYGECINRAVRDGLCDEHASDWQRSPEFEAATKDTGVIAYMRLGLQNRAMQTVNRKYKVLFMKRISGLLPETEEAF
jgi:hypothetical protein